MATINYYLERPDKNNERRITLVYLLSGNKHRFSTGIKVNEKHWDIKKQEVKKNVSGQTEFNILLNEYKRVIEFEERESMLEKRPVSIELIRTSIENFTSNNKQDSLFNSTFTDFVESSKGTKTVGTINHYHSTYSKLKEFEQGKKFTLTFLNMNKKFYDSFINFLIVDQGLMNNTVGKHIKVLKAFLNYASEIGINVNYDYKKFKVFREETDIVYLTIEELERIDNCKNLPPRLANVRDCFCFACYTGLRFSDLNQVNKDTINGTSLIFTTIKTKEKTVIPLSKKAMSILQRNNGCLPRMISNQKMNDYLKEIGQLAEINDVVTLTKFKGTERITVNEPKYNLLSSHTARRTFVTLSLEKGMQSQVVMSITGHKDYRTFDKYIKITEKRKSEAISEIWD